jgi:hypothetical protein
VCQVTTSFDSALSANMRGAWVVTVLVLAAVGHSCASRVPEEQLVLREETTARTSAAAGKHHLTIGWTTLLPSSAP